MNPIPSAAAFGRSLKPRMERIARGRMLPLFNRFFGKERQTRLETAAPPQKQREIRSETAASPPPAGLDFNELLHGCRSACLRAMPKVSGTMLSAGCSGRWYFDWIAERTGHSGRHIGVELYSPRPH